MSMHGRTRSGSPFMAALLLLVAAGLRASYGEDQTAATLTFTQKGSWWPGEPNGSAPHQSFPDNPDLKVPFELKPKDAARAALAAYRTPNGLSAPTFFPRPDASQKDCDAALATARRIYPNLPAGQKGFYYLCDNRHVVTSLQRIFLAAGTEEDAAALVAYCKRDHKWPILVGKLFLPAVAHIEARLSLLETGQLKALLSDEEPALRAMAACLLHQHGSAAGDRILVEALQDPKLTGEYDSFVPAAMLDWEHPDVLEGMRACFDRAVQKRKEIQPKIAAREPDYYDRVNVAEGVLPYLLVYGNQEDLRRLAEVKWDPEVIPQIAGVVRNPVPFLPAIAAVNDWYQATALFEKIAPALWSFDPVDRKKIFSRMQTLIFRMRFQEAKRQSGLPEDRQAGWADHRLRMDFNPEFSFVMPIEGLPFYLDCQFYDAPTSACDWIPSRDEYLPQIAAHYLTDKYYQPFKMGKYWYKGLTFTSGRKLDHFSTEKVAEAMKALALPPDVSEVCLAAHRTTTGRFYEGIQLDRYRDEIERRPFWLRKEGDGLLAGILQLRPRLADGKLQLSFDLSLNKAIARTMIDAGPDEDFPIGQYAQNYGKKLVKGVRIFRNGTWTDMEMAGPDKDGCFTAAADLGPEGLKNLRVTVDLEFFGQTISIPFDLFASVVAKKARAAKLGSTPDNEPNRGAVAAEEAKRPVPATEPSESKKEFSFTKVLGLTLADALKELKTSGIPTDGEEVDLLGSRAFLGKKNGIVIQLSAEGKVDKVVLSLLAGGEVGQYSGPIHGGLTSASNRDQIVAKLGEPAFSTEKAEGPIEYKYPVIGYRLPNCRLNFALVREKNALAEVTFIANEPAVDKDAP